MEEENLNQKDGKWTNIENINPLQMNDKDDGQINKKDNMINMSNEDKIFFAKKHEINISLDETKLTNYSNNISKDSINKNIESKFNIYKIEIFNKNNNYVNNLDYLIDIYLNLLYNDIHSKCRVNINYFNDQIDLNYQMRMILIDWIISIHSKLNFKLKTLFQTVHIIDLYLSKIKISRTHYQLLGVACFLISCKENEVYFPKLQEFVHLADDSFSVGDLKKMEKNVMKVLDFDILQPTSDEFYCILSKFFEFNEKQHFFGEYFLFSSLVDFYILKYNYSTIGIACIYIVMKFFGLKQYKNIYSSKHITGGIKPKEIKNCAKDLCFFVKELSKSSLKSIHEKYSLKEFGFVANLCQ